MFLYKFDRNTGNFHAGAWLRGNLKDKIQTIFNIEKSWKTSENAEEPSQERQRFDNLKAKTESTV